MNINQYTVSVIVPVYNMERYICDCLDSIIGQTLHSIEIICIDDGSVDKSLEIIKEYSVKYNNISVYTQSRKGAGIARNFGINVAKGDYIAFMDSDDYYPDSYVLEYLYTNAMSNNVAMAGGRNIKSFEDRKLDYTNIDNREELIKVVDYSDYQEFLYFGRFIYKRDMIINDAILFPDYKRFQDPPFMLRAGIAAGKILLSNRLTYVVRELDKTINLLSERVMLDILNAQKEMMSISMHYNYNLVQKEILNCLRGEKSYLACFVINNTNNISLILDNISTLFISGELKTEFKREFSTDSLVEWVKRQKEIVDSFCNQLLGKRVIIYGAGSFGKAFYDVIKNKDKILFYGFASTCANQGVTARGIIVKDILDYLDNKDELIVAVAIKDKKTRKEMVNNAINLGFENVIEIKERLIDFNTVFINDTEFACE